MLNQKKIGLTALLLTLAAGELFAGTLTNFVEGDVLVCFRKAGGTSDLVVDAGSVSTYSNAVPNQRITISQYATNQLYGNPQIIGLNSLTWSVFAWDYNSGTLYASSKRNSLNRQSTPLDRNSQNSQQVAINNINPIINGCGDIFGLATPFNTKSSSTALIEPDDTQSNPNSQYTSGQSYHSAIDAGGAGNDFGFFNYTIENTTSSSFASSGTVVRSDFYWLPPGSITSVGSFWGYFELNTNGIMTYVAYPTPPTVTTVAASAVTTASAQLNCTVATINTNTDNTSFFFQYGLTTSYGSATVVSNIGIASGSYGLSISNLAAGTQYYFRAAAYNQYGTNYGSGLTFTTGGGAPMIPVITAISRTNTTTYVSFTTGTSGTYTLRGTNSLTASASRTNWPAIAFILGNGSTNTLQDTTSDSSKFYLISAQ